MGPFHVASHRVEAALYRSFDAKGAPEHVVWREEGVRDPYLPLHGAEEGVRVTPKGEAPVFFDEERYSEMGEWEYLEYPIREGGAAFWGRVCEHEVDIEDGGRGEVSPGGVEGDLPAHFHPSPPDTSSYYATSLEWGKVIC